MMQIKVLNADRLQIILASAPKIFTREMAHFLWKERKTFIGNKTYMGSFRQSLLRKKRKSYGGTWSKGVANAFVGIPSGNMNDLRTMGMRLGVSDKWRKKIPYIEKLDSGYNVSPNSKKWLMIPFYKNMRGIQRAGRYGGTAMGATKNSWSKYIAQQFENKAIKAVSYHGKALFFGTDKSGTFKNKLMFVGVKHAKIKKQFDFMAACMRRTPGIIRRAAKTVDKTVAKLEKKFY
ncbi:MAG: hypothetical protein WC373_12210 [Smithella sp.]|jgi:hypothetical protein